MAMRSSTAALLRGIPRTLSPRSGAAATPRLASCAQRRAKTIATVLRTSTRIAAAAPPIQRGDDGGAGRRPRDASAAAASDAEGAAPVAAAPPWR